MSLSPPELALVEIGRWLRSVGYRFTVPTPETHRRVLARVPLARDVRDVFGWSRPFEPSLLPAAIVDALTVADALAERDGQLVARIRFASLADQLYVHSSYPTDGNAVFFGPDTYRFCAALDRIVTGAKRVIDVGCGSGAGALSIAARCEHLVLADLNPVALHYARANAILAGIGDRVEVVGGDLFEGVRGPADLVIANPPYISDEDARLYCHGGDQLGTEIAIRIVDEGLRRTAPGGQLVMYTGAPIVDGIDILRDALEPRLAAAGASWTYREIDPDVFGEELDRPAYATVERIAVVVLVARCSA